MRPLDWSKTQRPGFPLHSSYGWFLARFSLFQPYLLCGEGDGTPLQYSCLENPMDGGAWWEADHGVAKSQTRLSDFPFTFHFHALEKEMATHSSVLAWRIPGTGEPGGLLSMGSHRVGHDWSNLAAAAACCWCYHYSYFFFSQMRKLNHYLIIWWLSNLVTFRDQIEAQVSLTIRFCTILFII